MFHSISAINNAGFDIMGSHSIAPYYTHYYVQFVFIFLFVFGGIGFPVIYDVFRYFVAKAKKQPFRFSLFTKVSMLTYLLVTIFGLGITFLIELLTNNQIVTVIDDSNNVSTVEVKTF